MDLLIDAFVRRLKFTNPELVKSAGEGLVRVVCQAVLIQEEFEKFRKLQDEEPKS